MIVFYIVLMLVFFLLMGCVVVQIAACESNIRAKRYPERPRSRHWWQRWEVWCRLERGGFVIGEKESGWYPFRWMANETKRHLEGDPSLLVASIDSLHEGLMIWPQFEVRRLKWK